MKELLAHRSALGDGVEGAVASIVEAVRERGDEALIELTERYDHATLTKSTLRVSPREISRALASLPARSAPGAGDGCAPHPRLPSPHRREVLHLSRSVRDAAGSDRAPTAARRHLCAGRGGGLSLDGPDECDSGPGRRRQGSRDDVSHGHATSIPRWCSPRRRLREVDEVYRVGGAQAIAALAYGTETIRAVDKIVGPGNAYVQTAKRMVYGIVDIDKTAGPSEVLIIADDSADPAWVAADLIAQAEHGSGGESAIVLTTSRSTAMNVVEALEDALLDLPRAGAVRTALERRGAVVLVRSVAEACEISNQIAPEHLEIEVKKPEHVLKSVRAAGAVFLGGLSPAPLGDYLAGPNHVLPTGGTARFASPLGGVRFREANQYNSGDAGRD